ncbi:hypothetical protein ASF70_13110 [Rhizobium sp. Leaf321]|uniref:hypothetical protein n=1 Tax=Rhizobium sp. Leaf321 TaxID=1736335 RepID=UPI00071483DC|nr:hypothetical protein [Rhizobium sp. Leaf321]KQQ72460.1 hypothetical protein ASF70_13110 [Rhizobium sp. Leaf321]
MTDTDDRLAVSVAGYLIKHDTDVFQHEEVEDWIHADIETFEGLSPSQRDELTREGIRMVRAHIFGDRVTKQARSLEALRSRWPRMIIEGAEFSLGPGWVPLLNRAAQRLDTYPSGWCALLRGAKEKFGCLVLHISYDRDERGSRSEVERLREEIRLTSLSICEACGRPGRLRMAGYAKTVCDRHATEMGIVRDEDGLYADPWTWAEPDARPSRSEAIVLGARSLQAFLADVVELEAEAETLEGRPRELLKEYAGYLVDAAKGAIVKTEYLQDYVRGEVAGWPDVLSHHEEDREWLRGWLMKMILAEYDRARRKQKLSPSQ